MIKAAIRRTRNARTRNQVMSFPSFVRPTVQSDPARSSDLSGAIWSAAALPRDRKPHESESEKHEEGLKDEVHLCVRKVMEAKDPMDPDNIEAQDEAGAREYA